MSGRQPVLGVGQLSGELAVGAVRVAAHGNERAGAFHAGVVHVRREGGPERVAALERPCQRVGGGCVHGYVARHRAAARAVGQGKGVQSVQTRLVAPQGPNVLAVTHQSVFPREVQAQRGGTIGGFAGRSASPRSAGRRRRRRGLVKTRRCGGGGV